MGRPPGQGAPLPRPLVVGRPPTAGQVGEGRPILPPPGPAPAAVTPGAKANATRGVVRTAAATGDLGRAAWQRAPAGKTSPRAGQVGGDAQRGPVVPVGVPRARLDEAAASAVDAMRVERGVAAVTGAETTPGRLRVRAVAEAEGAALLGEAAAPVAVLVDRVVEAPVGP